MHRSRINGMLIDCRTEDIDAAARFWAAALGRAIDPDIRVPVETIECSRRRRARSAFRSSA